MDPVAVRVTVRSEADNPGMSSIHPKVAASGIAGAVTLILVWVLSLFGVDMPAEVASACTVIGTTVGGYLAPSPPTR